MEKTEKHFNKEPLFWQQNFEDNYAGNVALVQFDDSEVAVTSTIEDKGDFLIRVLKKVFLFLPGSILLFMTTNFLFLAFFSHHWDFFQSIMSLPVLALYGFMVMFGLGDIKNPKHLALPFSIVGLSLIVCVLSFLLGGPRGIPYSYSYSLYLIPLVFLFPLLTKKLIDTERE